MTLADAVPIVVFVAAVGFAWAILLLALARGLYVLGRAEILQLLKRSAQLTLLAGVPVTFLLALGAGQLTGLVPFPHRAVVALVAALLALPFYGVLVMIAVAERFRPSRTNPSLRARLAGTLAVVLLGGAALILAASILLLPAGRFMG